MPLNFHYAAHTYLDNWVECDRYARSILDFGSDSPVGIEQACKQIALVANIYGIAPNFSKDSEKQALRYSPVWTAVALIKNRPASEQDAKDCVGQLVEALKPIYGLNLWSAASKLLWMRFGKPIVIYDSLAWKWMCNNGELSERDGSYSKFYDAWRMSFRKYENDVDSACSDLRKTDARRFLCPFDLKDVEFEPLVSSDWFAERVFDHAVVNEIAMG
jgi:hypothetical protein